MTKVSAVNKYVEPVMCRIEKAANGFISKGYGDGKPMIAKTLPEAQRLQAKLLK